MSEEEINKFLKDLFAKEIDINYSLGSTYKHFIIREEGRGIVETMIRKFLLENNDKELGELKAKVYTYEKIIANSNFAPIILKESDKNEI